MKILVTSDWHLTDHPRDQYRHDTLKTVRKIVKAERVDAVYMLGDLTEAKDRHAAALVNDVVAHLYQFAKICPITILKGNHDYLASANDPYFQFVRRIDNVTWINEPAMVGERTLFLPHTRDHHVAWKDLNFASFDTIFAHNTFEGAEVESGRKMGGIPLNMFSGDQRVIAGDIHVPQTFGPVTYVGAPYTIDFGDGYQPRVLILEPGKKPRSIPVFGPQKVIIELDQEFQIVNDVEIKPGDIAQIRIRIDAKNYDNWVEMREEVTKWGAGEGLKVWAVRPVVETRAPTHALSGKAAPARTDLEILKDYAKARGLTKETLAMGLEML